MDEKIKLGISACLMGQEVRWNGGHARDRYLTDILGKYVEYVPVCPEVECGMGVPRETLRLVGDPDNPNLVTSKTNIDHTRRMIEWAQEKVKTLEKENLCGFVFKKNSPSSGLFEFRLELPKECPKKKVREYSPGCLRSTFRWFRWKKKAGCMIPNSERPLSNRFLP